MIPKEIFVSIDVEADGPIPGEYSMLSLGAAAVESDNVGENKLVDQFYINLRELPFATKHHATMTWWNRRENIEAYKLTRENTVDAVTATSRFYNWVIRLPGKPVCVGYPVTYDWNFVYWYLIKFCGRSPFGMSALDIKSYAMCLMKTPFRQTIKKTMPKEWRPKGYKHTHVAIDDAIEQGFLFLNMLKYNKII